MVAARRAIGQRRRGRGGGQRSASVSAPRWRCARACEPRARRWPQPCWRTMLCALACSLPEDLSGSGSSATAARARGSWRASAPSSLEHANRLWSRRERADTARTRAPRWRRTGEQALKPEKEASPPDASSSLRRAELLERDSPWKALDVEVAQLQTGRPPWTTMADLVRNREARGLHVAEEELRRPAVIRAAAARTPSRRAHFRAARDRTPTSAISAYFEAFRWTRLLPRHVRREGALSPRERDPLEHDERARDERRKYSGTARRGTGRRSD